MFHKPLTLTLSCAVALVLSDPARSEVKYDVIEIPPLQGMDTTIGTATADKKIVSFVSIGDVNGAPTANGAVCRWTPKGCTVTDLGLIGDGGTGISATISAITRNGEFVAGTRQTERPLGPNQAFLQRTQARGGGMPVRFDLPGLAEGENTAALGITVDDRNVAGFAFDKAKAMSAVIWEVATAKLRARLNGLDPAVENGGRAAAYGGRSAFWIIGFALKTGDGRTRERAVKWEEPKMPVEFPAPADQESIAISANVRRDAVGSMLSANGSIGAYWAFGQKAVIFGTGFETQPRCINDDRLAVGSDRQKGKARAAMLWDLKAEKITGVDLNTLVDGKLGWVLSIASGINGDGVIVGTGALNGKTRGFILVPK